MREQPEFYVECDTPEEVGRSLARGFAATASHRIAAECGAEPGDPDELDDILEAHLHPHGEGEPPEGGEAA